MLNHHFRDDDGLAKRHLFPQIQRIARRWIDGGYLVCAGVPIGAILYEDQLARAAQKIHIALSRATDSPVKAVLDPYNPRSVAFQVAALNEHIASLPSLKEHGLIERPQRLAVALQAMLTTAEASSLDVKHLFSLEQDLLNLADAIGLHYFPHGPNASRPEKLTGLA